MESHNISMEFLHVLADVELQWSMIFTKIP